MRPRGQRSNIFSPAIPPLPPNKTVIDVFSDFLRYLHDCARLYIQESHAGGTSLWSSVSANISYVLTHPNGWEGAQQQLMRKAAVAAGMIPDSVSGHARLTFATEGEASLHGCLAKRAEHSNLQVSCDYYLL